MKYLLDSNACIDHLRLGAASSVKARLATHQAADAGLCSVVVGELFFGCYGATTRPRGLAHACGFFLPASDPCLLMTRRQIITQPSALI